MIEIITNESDEDTVTVEVDSKEIFMEYGDEVGSVGIAAIERVVMALGKSLKTKVKYTRN